MREIRHPFHEPGYCAAGALFGPSAAHGRSRTEAGERFGPSGYLHFLPSVRR
jgi:hypothetical protein